MDIMPSVFNYTNYREFLRDFYKSKKQENSGFSYTIIARKVGFKSTGFFTQIINGQTNISQSIITSFAKFMGLNRRESEYFELIVNYDQSKTQQEKIVYLDRLQKYRNPKIRVLSTAYQELYRQWYYLAVRDLLSVCKFDGDFIKLARMMEPAITGSQAREAIKLLEDLQLIIKTDSSEYKLQDSLLSSGISDKEKNIAIVSFALQMLELSKHALGRLPKESRYIGGVGVAVSEKTFERMKDEIRSLNTRLLAMAQDDTNPERVYHIGMQAIPLSKKIVQGVANAAN